ncbi:MAG: 6-carboxytetrahydropterin synthase [Deltaproteobacteria bacterium]
MGGPFARNAFYNTRMFSVTQEHRFCYGHRLLEAHPTAENIAEMIFDHAQRAGLPVALVEVVEQQGSIAAYAP